MTWTLNNTLLRGANCDEMNTISAMHCPSVVAPGDTLKIDMPNADYHVSPWNWRISTRHSYANLGYNLNVSNHPLFYLNCTHDSPPKYSGEGVSITLIHTGRFKHQRNYNVTVSLNPTDVASSATKTLLARDNEPNKAEEQTEKQLAPPTSSNKDDQVKTQPLHALVKTGMAVAIGSFGVFGAIKVAPVVVNKLQELRQNRLPLPH